MPNTMVTALQHILVLNSISLQSNGERVTVLSLCGKSFARVKCGGNEETQEGGLT